MKNNEEYLSKVKKLNFFLNDLESKVAKNPETERILKIVADTDHLPRIIWDNETRIIYANDKFLEALGYDFHDVVGKKFFNDDGTSDFITPEFVNPSIDVVEENAKNGIKMVKGMRNKWFNKKGEEIEIDWLIGFNDNRTKFGSTQCITIDGDYETICEKCNQIIKP